MPGTQIAIAAVKPSFVMFEARPVEDRAASIAQDRFVTKDVDFAIVTPAGSKDRIPRKLPDWFEYLAMEVQQERYPSSWLQHYKDRYAEWKRGEALTIDGTHIKLWNALSPSQLRTLLDINVYTVEQLAEANEEVVAKLGMGGRDLKRRAAEFLLTANDLGKQATAIAGLTAENGELKQQLAGMAAQIEAMSQARQTAPPPPGPPPAPQSAAQISAAQRK